jgi:outer membrane protein TolC
MRLPYIRLRHAGLLVALCATVVLCSCQSAFLSRVPSPGRVLYSMKSAILDPFTGVDHQQMVRSNAATNLVNYRVKPVTAAVGKRSLTLAECRGLALASSLDLHAARMEELSKRAISYSNKTKMLPHFLFSGELSQRENLQFSYSDVLGQEGRHPSPGLVAPDATGVTNYSTSHERSTWRYVAEARWSPTDAALAYYLTKSSKNDYAKAHHQKVRAAQKLVAMVDAAYFRLLSLQQSYGLAGSLSAERSRVAGKMREAFEKNLVDVQDYSRANRHQIRARRLHQRIRNEMAKQINILASGMGLSPDNCVDGGLVVVGDLAKPTYGPPLCQMEMTAVHNRPEAFEAGLNHLNSVNDLKRTIVKYCPKVTGFWRYTRDKDKFLLNKDWKEVGVLVYFDVLDWLSNASESKAAKYNAAKTSKEMGSVALGIASQVRLAALDYFDALDELKTSSEAWGSTQQVLEVARARADRDDLDRIALSEAKADTYQNRIEYIRALGETNATLAELQGAMGTNYNEALACN